MKEIVAEDLQEGDVLALPFGTVATVVHVKVGREYVNVRLAEFPPTRIGRYQPVLIETEE